ncbi:hypothetical protein F444_21458 [Phytophthora nicotianae P1976]|uniref:Uncharacterized protein n=1 Tax=Phytophthora nicotianae P1976 TaxID=1317066 RepID=A0A080Z119_PHYNI|nr:hypothetical protein F444_21458 [Phytophthora nicotianae P1976]
MGKPIKCRAIGGHWVKDDRAVDLIIQIGTVAGIVEPQKPEECLLIESDDDEFIAGQDLLKVLGIDVDRLLEQLAQPTVDNEIDPYDVVDDKRTEPPDIVEILAELNKLLDDAIKE